MFKLDRGTSITMPLTHPSTGYFDKIKKQEFNERNISNLRGVPVISHYFTCESPNSKLIKEHLGLSSNPKLQNFAQICRLAFLAKRGIDLATDESIHLSKSEFPKDHRGSAPIHYQALEEGSIRKRAAESLLSLLPDLDAHYTKAFDIAISRMQEQNINLNTNQPIIIKLIAPFRHPHNLDASKNYLTTAYLEHMIKSFTKISKERNLNIKFQSANIEAIQRTSRTDADPDGRLAQQGCFYPHGIEKNDLVAFVDDHIEASAAAINGINSLANQEAKVLFASSLSALPLGRILVLQPAVEELLNKVLTAKDSNNNIEIALKELHLKKDNLSNTEALTIIAKLIDKNNSSDKYFVSQFEKIYDSLQQDENGNTIQVPIPSDKNSITAVLNHPAIQPKKYKEILIKALEEQRYTVAPFKPDSIYVFDFDEVIYTESKEEFNNYEPSLIHGSIQSLQSAFKAQNYLVLTSTRKQEQLDELVEKSNIQKFVQFDAIAGDMKKTDTLNFLNMLNTIGLTKKDLTKENAPKVFVIGSNKSNIQLAENLRNQHKVDASTILLDRFGNTKYKSSPYLSVTKNHEEVQQIIKSTN